MYITQDDNALYGFNIREANELKALVAQLGLEVGLQSAVRLGIRRCTRTCPSRSAGHLFDDALVCHASSRVPFSSTQALTRWSLRCCRVWLLT